MNNLPIIYTITYNEQESKIRLDKFLAQNITTYSRTKIQSMIANGALSINNTIVKSKNIELKFGDILSLECLKPEHHTNLKPYNIDLSIVYEDNDILVIDKPPGLIVHPGAGNRDNTLVNALVHKYELSNISPTDLRPGIVHRLDKDTSGLIIVAKNNASHFALSKMLANREIQRTYLALVYGVLCPTGGTITTQYARSRKNPKMMCVLKQGGKNAITNYTTVKKLHNDTISLVKCTLKTGRTHQIRVHMEYLGHPIVGDQTYGRSLNFNLSKLELIQQQAVKNFSRQALHAFNLEFQHPTNGKIMQFNSKPAADFAELLETLGIHTY